MKWLKEFGKYVWENIEATDRWHTVAVFLLMVALIIASACIRFVTGRDFYEDVVEKYHLDHLGELIGAVFLIFWFFLFLPFSRHKKEKREHAMETTRILTEHSVKVQELDIEKLGLQRQIDEFRKDEIKDHDKEFYAKVSAVLNENTIRELDDNGEVIFGNKIHELELFNTFSSRAENYFKIKELQEKYQSLKDVSRKFTKTITELYRPSGNVYQTCKIDFMWRSPYGEPNYESIKIGASLTRELKTEYTNFKLAIKTVLLIA